MKTSATLALFLGLTCLAATGCFGGQGLKLGDLAPELTQKAPRLQGPAVLVFLRGFG